MAQAYKNTRYAVVKEPNPEAALYFEHAYALHGTPLGAMMSASDLFLPKKEPTVIEDFILSPEDSIGEEHWDSMGLITKNALEIIKRNFLENQFTNTFLEKIEASIENYGGDIYIERARRVKDFVDLHQDQIDNENFDAEAFLDNLMISAATAYYRQKGLYTVPVLENVKSPNWVRGNSLEDGVELALLDLNLVDGATIEWEQVKEVRDDKKSEKQLRNLRLFLDGLDIEKGKDYVQDLLMKKVENYEIAAKKHGFQLSKGPLKALLSMKQLPRLALYGIYGLCSLIDPSLTTPSGLVTALGAGELVTAFQEFGGFAVSVKEQQVMKELDGEHKDIEYLVSIKKKLE